MNFIERNLSNIIASIALLTSFTSVLISFFTFRLQRTHNIKSVKPILHVGQWDYENELCVTVKNCGSGIAVVKKLCVLDRTRTETRNHVYAWLPSKLESNVNYSKYWTPYSEFVVQPGEIIDLVKVPIDDKKPEQIAVREKLRAILCNLIVRLEYEDIYENKMPLKEMQLQHFARIDNVNKSIII